MTVTLSPELEGLIQRKLDSGEYETPQQVIENAVYRMGKNPVDPGMGAAELQAFVDEGWEEAERSETVPGDEARAYLAKARAERHRAEFRLTRRAIGELRKIDEYLEQNASVEAAAKA
jgi:Arc/MetJ-type ribon-helix-helix transcriptional regulator